MKGSILLLLLGHLVTANLFADSSVAMPVNQLEFYNKTSLGTLGIDYSSFTAQRVNTYGPDYYGTVKYSSEGSGCDNEKKILLGTPTLIKNISYLAAPLVAVRCQSAAKIKITNQLNPQICMDLASCYKGSLSFNREENQRTLIAAREKTAAEAIALISEKAIGQMIDVQELKKYAAEKYGDSFLPAECKKSNLIDVPPKEEGKCLTNVVDKGFEIAQRMCTAPLKGCYPEYLKFIAGKKSEEGKSLLSEFIKKGSEENVKKYTATDTATVKEISKIISKTNLSAEDRTKLILDYMGEHYHELDPIFKSYYDQSSRAKGDGRVNDVAEGFKKYIAQNDGKNDSEILNDLESLRMSEAKRMLATKCEPVIKMKKLCTLVNDVIGGAEVQVPKERFDKMLSLANGQNNEQKSIKKVQEKTLEREEMANYVSRCNTFILDPSLTNQLATSVDIVKLSGGFDLFSNPSGENFNTRNVNFTDLGAFDITKDEGQRIQIIINARGDVRKEDSFFTTYKEKSISSTQNERGNSTVLAKVFSTNTALPENYNVKNIELAKAGKVVESEPVIKKDDAVIAPVVADLKGANVVPQTSTFASKNTQPIQKAESIPDVSSIDFSAKPEFDKKINSNNNADYNQMLGKIAGLEDKLAQAQKKSAVPEKENNGKSDSKTQEETELIKELKNAKNSLSEMVKINDEAQPTAAASLSEPASIKQISKKEESPQAFFDETTTPSVSSTAPTSVGRNIASIAANPQGMANVEEVKPSQHASSRVANEVAAATSANFDGVVLTKLDGVERTKAKETINNMIVAQDGKPFYIEEGGEVKQIIPEMIDGKIRLNEDGTPVYKTVIEGKVGQFKMAAKNKTKKEVSKNVSPADVKKQDYQVETPAVRYKDFQKAFMLKN